MLNAQLIFGVILALLALPLGASTAISVLIGAGTCLLANAVLARSVFRRYRAQRLEDLMAGFYRAEVVKIALIIGVFGIVFVIFDGLNIVALLAAYFLVQVVPTLIAARSGKR